MKGQVATIARRWGVVSSFWLLMFGLFELDWTHGSARSLLLVGVAACVAIALCRKAAPQDEAAGVRGLEWLVIGLLALHLVYGVATMTRDHVSAVGEATLAAVEALGRGENLYSSPLDPGAVTIAGPAFGGYKYLPLMPAVYWPLIATFGRVGLALTNLALDGAVAALAFAVARKGGGRRSGLMAAALYLSLPIVLAQVLKQGNTDLLPMAFILGSILLTDRSPGLAGLLIGFSLSSKLMPGMAAVPACVPARGRLRFAGGFVLGLVPAAIGWIGAPDAFVNNIIRFNTARPVDTTSWMLGLSPLQVDLSRGALGLAAIVLAVLTLIGARRPAVRCGAAALSMILLILGGPVIHHNYVLWFIPFACVVLAKAVWTADAVQTDQAGSTTTLVPS